MNVGDMNGNKSAKEEVDSGINLDSSKKNLELWDAPDTFKTKVWIHFGVYNINKTNKIFSFVYVM